MEQLALLLMEPNDKDAALKAVLQYAKTAEGDAGIRIDDYKKHLTVCQQIIEKKQASGLLVSTQIDLLLQRAYDALPYSKG